MNNNEKFKNILPKRPENSHKGAFGSVLNIAGSGFYSGAAYFSSISALKVGCGKSTLASSQNVLNVVASLSPNIILFPLEETKEKTISPKSLKKLEPVFENYNVISVGCGLSTNKGTAKFFEKLIKILSKSQITVVVDADGLNILSKLNLPILPPNLILTPHPKELARLMGVNVENILLQSEFWAKKCAEKYNCTVILKLHRTIVTDNCGHIYVNESGNSALSHGGSGDVLCGMITGFMAQKVNAFDACCLAVHLHGVASELASKDLTEYSTLSSDLLNYIPQAIKTVI